MDPQDSVSRRIGLHEIFGTKEYVDCKPNRVQVREIKIFSLSINILINEKY